MRTSMMILSMGLLVLLMLPAHSAKDRYGDTLPEGAIQRLGSVKLQYGVNDLGYLPDGRAVLARGSSLEIWDLTKPEQLGTQKPADRIISFDVKSDGHTVLIADNSNIVTEWDIDSEESLYSFDTGQERLQYAHYSPDEQRILTTGYLPPTIKEWTLESGEELQAIEGDCMEYFRRAVYIGDGTRAVVGGGYENILAEYDLQTGELLKNWFSNYCVYHLQPSPDFQKLAVGSRSMATEWKIDGWEELNRFTGHAGGAVNCVEYTPDGTAILTGSRDGSIRVWNCEAGEVVLRWFPHASYVRQIAVSPDGQRVLSYGAGVVAESDIETGESLLPFERHSASVEAVAMIDANTAVSGSADGTLRIWDITSGECTETFEGATLGAWSVAVSPDGAQIAAGCKDSVLRIFDRESGEIVAEYEGHRGYVRSLTYAEDGRLLSTAGDGTLKIWENGENTATLEGHRGGVLCVDVSSDGARALTGGRDGTVRLWDLSKVEQIAEMTGHRGWVESVLFAGNDFAYSTGRDGRILKWDLQGGEITAEMVHGGWARSLVLTPDGRRLCAGGEDNVVTCWDMQEQSKITTLRGHGGTITELAVSDDGEHLISASEDNSLLVWQLPEIAEEQ